MNDQQIYTLMAKTPKIRAVQIADALDQELEDVQKALRPLVEIGDVVESDGRSPNGYPTKIYDLSDKFKRSWDGAALAIPTFVPSQSEKLTKVAIAIAHLTEHGRATSTELRDVLGLADKKGSPSSYIKDALRDGRVKWDGKVYVLGGAPCRAAFGGSLNLPGSTPFPPPFPPPAPPPPATKTQRQPGTPGPVVSVQTAQPFRCGMWLDDVIELQRGGATVDKLARDEALVLRDFLNRVLPTEESA
jgi:hypothetical protein